MLTEGTGWSRRHWFLWLLVLFAGQIGLLFWSAKEPATVATPPKAGLSVLLRWGGEHGAPPSSAWDDPTLFALVSTQSLSRSAWLAISPREYHVTNRTEPWRWLDPPLEALCANYSEFIQTNFVAEDVIMSKLPPVLAKPVVPVPIFVASTIVTPKDGLAERPLLPGQVYPQQSDLLLTNTVVRVTADSTGRTLSAALLSSSGSPKADQEALQFARNARFAPSETAAAAGVTNRSRLTFGTLVFHWSSTRWNHNLAIAAMPQ